MGRRRGMLATMVQIQREAERDRARQARAIEGHRREVERAAAARNRAAIQDQKLRERMYAEDRTREATEGTAQVERQVEILQGVLAATLAVDDHLDLEALKQPPPYPAFDPRVVGPPPAPPNEADFAVAAPSTLGRVFSGSKHAAHAEQRKSEYQQALNEYWAATQRHAQHLEHLRRQHDANVAHQIQQHRQHVEQITALQRGLAAREPRAVVTYLDLVLEAANYPDDFPHTWRLSYVTASGHLSIEYDLPRADVVPNQKSYKYVKASDTVAATARPVAQVRGIYAEVLRQTVLRVVHEVLEADRGNLVRTVVLNGYVSDADPATGQAVRRCVVALATSRERFMGIDLSRVNTVDCLTHLEAKVSRDPIKLQAVEPIELVGSLEADYTIDTDEEPDPETHVQGGDSAIPADDSTVRPVTATQQQELTAGQNVQIDNSLAQVNLIAGDADMSVLLIGSNGRVDRDEDFLFYNNPQSPDGAVTLNAGTAQIAVNLLPDRCERVVLVISPDSDNTLADATAALHQPATGAGFRFRPDNTANLSAMVWGEIYRRQGGWRLRAVGQGWDDGLAGLARDYGVEVD